MEHNHVSLKFFGHPPDIQAKIPGLPAQSLIYLAFEGHTELFGPHPWAPPRPVLTPMCV